MAEMATKPGPVKLLEQWMKSYTPEKLFDRTGKLIPELAALAPAGARRIGANPHANGGMLLKDLRLPDFRAFSTVRYAADGYNVPWDRVFQDVTVCLGYVIGLSVLGYFLLRTREIAR